MTNDTIAIIKFFKNLWVAIKGFTFKTEIVNQIEIPRKKGEGNRAKFIKGLKNKWWFDDGQKAADKFNSI